MRNILILIILLGVINISYAGISYCENCINIINDTGTEPIETESLFKLEIKEDKKQSKVDYKIDHKKYKLKKPKLKKDLSKFTDKYLEEYPVYEIEEICSDADSGNCTINKKLLKKIDLKKGDELPEFELHRNYKVGENSISWTAGTYIDIVVDAVNGTASNPYNLEQIYDYDVANSLNCFIYGNTNYKVYIWNGSKCSIRVGSHATDITYFLQTNSMIKVDARASTTTAQKIFMHLNRNSNITFGELYDYRETQGDVTIQFLSGQYYNSPFATTIYGGTRTLNLLGVNIKGVFYKNDTNIQDMLIASTNNIRSAVINTITGSRAHISKQYYYDFYNYQSIRQNPLVREPVDSTYDYIYSGGGNFVLWYINLGAAARNVKSFSTSYLARIQQAKSYENYSVTNVDVDTYDMYFTSDGQNNSKFYIYNELDLNVLIDNESLYNASVLITSNNGSIIYNGSTNSTGQIPTQELEYGFTEYTTSGVQQSFVLSDYTFNNNPYNITIEYLGYDTYNGVIDMKKKRELFINLIESTVTEDNFAVGYILGRDSKSMCLIN